MGCRRTTSTSGCCRCQSPWPRSTPRGTPRSSRPRCAARRMIRSPVPVPCLEAHPTAPLKILKKDGTTDHEIGTELVVILPKHGFPNVKNEAVFFGGNIGSTSSCSHTSNITMTSAFVSTQKPSQCFLAFSQLFAVSTLMKRFFSQMKCFQLPPESAVWWSVGGRSRPRRFSPRFKHITRI